jgi:hypothetical protein
MNYIRGHTEDEGTIARLAVQREGLEREGSKRVQQALEVVHSLL